MATKTVDLDPGYALALTLKRDEVNNKLNAAVATFNAEFATFFKDKVLKAVLPEVDPNDPALAYNTDTETGKVSITFTEATPVPDNVTELRPNISEDAPLESPPVS